MTRTAGPSCRRRSLRAQRQAGEIRWSLSESESFREAASISSGGEERGGVRFGGECEIVIAVGFSALIQQRC